MSRRRALLSDETARQNKIWLAVGWNVPWRWCAVPLVSRLEFLLDGKWEEARSWDEDVKPHLREAGTRTA